MFHNMRFFLFFLSFSSLLWADADRKYRVFVDGIFDLAHYGHQKAFQKARTTAAQHFEVSPEQIEVIVGVCGGDIKSYKREPVFTLEQRTAQIESFKGVDQVISDAPLTFDDVYLEKYQIDLVMHGDDYSQIQIETYYPGPFEKNIFKTYPYDPGISTTQILRRTSQLTFESLLGKNNLSCEDREVINKALAILEKSKI